MLFFHLSPATQGGLLCHPIQVLIINSFILIGIYINLRIVVLNCMQYSGANDKFLGAQTRSEDNKNSFHPLKIQN